MYLATTSTFHQPACVIFVLNLWKTVEMHVPCCMVFLITLQLQQGDLKTATNTYEKHWNVLLFLESQAPTDMNRYYSEQLCHMECNSTAKLTCLRERKRVAPRLAINFNKMANARKWFQGCLQPSVEIQNIS